MNPFDLTDEEMVVVWAWSVGRDVAWVASFFGLNPHATTARGKAIRRKLGARTKTQAVAMVLRFVLGSEDREAEAAPESERAVTFARLCAAAREIALDGVDGELALSYALWPPERFRLAA